MVECISEHKEYDEQGKKELFKKNCYNEICFSLAWEFPESKGTRGQRKIEKLEQAQEAHEKTLLNHTLCAGPVRKFG